MSDATTTSAPAATDPRAAWTRVLVWLSVVVVASDLVFFALIRTVVPPLLIGAVVTVVGLGLLRRVPRTAIAILGLAALVLVAGNLPFAIDHLAHPESGIDFAHAVIGVVGRLLAAVAAIGALRRTSGARTTSRIALAIGGLTVLTALVATLATPGDAPEGNEITVGIVDATFDDPIRTVAGGTVFVDNRDLFRHTFTVVGTDLDVELPARQGVRVPIELDAGTYDVICAVPGHEFMRATLTVD